MASLFAGGVAIGALLAFTVAPMPAIAVTVSPSSAALSDAADFSFDGVRTSDFSSINLTSTGMGTFTFKERGFLPFATFDPGNFTPPGLNGSTAATPYGLYLAFSGTGMLSSSANNLYGSFSDLNYTLMGDPNYNSTFNHYDTEHQAFCVGCDNDIVLAKGSLLQGGTNALGIVQASSENPLPSAFVDLLFVGNSSRFFVSPSVPFSLGLDMQFSNTSNVISSFTQSLPEGVDKVINIGTIENIGGAGSGQFVVLGEPKSLMLLALFLLFVGLFRKYFKFDC